MIVPEKLADLEITPEGWEWRANQRELAEAVAASTKPIIMVEAEPGTGKSLVPIAAAKAAGKRVIILTSQKNLQEQYVRDFPVQTIMGRNNFTCNLNGRNAADAPCVVGVRCEQAGEWDIDTGMPLNNPTCNYFRAKAVARRAQVSIHNYAYYLREIGNYGSRFSNSADWIVMDEAHYIDRILMEAAVVTITFAEMEEFKIAPIATPPTDGAGWLEWAKRSHGTLSGIVTRLKGAARAAGLSLAGDDRFADEPESYAALTPSGGRVSRGIEAQANDEDIRALIRSLRRARDLLSRVEMVKLVADLDDWVFDRDSKGREIYFKPMYGKHAFAALRSEAEKIILMSAYLAPEMLIKVLDLDPDDVEIVRSKHGWDRSKSPVVYCPLRKFNFKTDKNVWSWAVGMIDLFVDFYAPDKGLVHVPSIKLRDTVMTETQLSQKFIAYDSDRYRAVYPTKEMAIKSFIGRKGQCVLLGQSISTGLDIPYVPQWQIILKMSFPNTSDPAIAARAKVDKTFYNHMVICELVQAVGRVKRAEDHDGPTVIFDENFGWFFAANKAHFPAWFRKVLIYDGWEHYPQLSIRRRSVAMQRGIILS